MVRTGFFWRLLLTLLLVAVLVAGGAGLFRLGWAQGYQAGTQATTAGSSGAAPQLPFYYPYPPYGFFPFFHPFGIFACIGGFLLLFFLFGGLFRLWGWRHWAGGARHGYWGHSHEGEWHEHTHTPSDKGRGNPVI
jgi:hypothetical protein